MYCLSSVFKRIQGLKPSGPPCKLTAVDKIAEIQPYEIRLISIREDRLMLSNNKKKKKWNESYNRAVQVDLHHAD